MSSAVSFALLAFADVASADVLVLNQWFVVIELFRTIL